MGKTSVLEALLVSDFALAGPMNFFSILKLKHSFTDIKYRDLFFFCNRSNEDGIKNISFQMNGVNFRRQIRWGFDFPNKNILIEDSRDKMKQIEDSRDKM